MNMEIQKIKNDMRKLYDISRPINAFVTFKRIKAAKFASELAIMKNKGKSNSKTFIEHYKHVESNQRLFGREFEVG